MTRAEIVAEIRARGMTLRGLDRQHGLCLDTISRSFTKRFPKANRIVADFIGRPLAEVWPAWYAAPVDLRRKWTPETFDAVLRRIEAGEMIKDIQNDKTAPCQDAVSRFGRANPEFRQRLNAAMQGRQGVKVSAERLGKAVEAIRSGSFIATQKAVSVMTLHRYRKRDENLARLISAYYRPSEPRGLAGRFGHRETMVRALRSDEVFAIAHRAVPRGLAPFIRDDVMSDVVVGLLSGEITPDQAPAAARRFASAYFNHDISMDQKVGDGLALGAMISDGSFDASGTGIAVRSVGW